MKKLNELPPYMLVLYNNIYGSKILSGVCDDIRVAKLRSLWQYDKIVKDVVCEVAKNAHVLQIGLTFGDELDKVYEKVCRHGKVDVYDVSEVQIELAKAKYDYNNMEICNYNAALKWDEKYDVIICYNLLRDLPPKTRKMVMDNVLMQLATGGRAVFVDYAKPAWWNPLKWPLLLFNRLYVPFAESLWQQPLENFCSKKTDFRWLHTYYCGHLFQKVVATRKILSNEDVKKLTKLFRGK